MHYYLRRAPARIFNGSAMLTPEQRQLAREKFQLRPADRGLSVFEVSSQEDADLVIAALACSQRRPSDEAMPYLALTDPEFGPFGAVTPTLGKTVVPRANLLHRELQWPQKQLFALAELLLDQGKRAESATRLVVRSCLLRLDPAEVTDEQARGWLSEFQQRHKG
jgi:hypothetical protein